MVQTYILRALALFLTPLILSAILAGVQKQKHTKDGEVHLPIAFLIIGIIASLVCLIPAVLVTFSDEPAWLSAVFMVFSLEGGILILGFINCRIRYDNNGFVYKNLFGVKRSATYDQVTAIKENLHEKYIYMGDRRVMIDKFSVNGTDFINLVEEKYRDLHDGKILPRIRKTKHDLFNGNITDPSTFIALFIIVGVSLLGLMGTTVARMYMPYTSENTVKKTVVFNSYILYENSIQLFSEYNDIYSIDSLHEHLTDQEIDELCNEYRIYTAYCEENSSKRSETDYNIIALSYDDHYLISFDETNASDRQFNTVILLVLAGCLLLWIMYFVVAVIVGRNPKKFKLTFVRLFFNRKQYLR